MSGKTKDGLDKSNKYDRQIRLWGEHGQSALEAARVCLINATATGTEILKNLILPGIGSFTIVDGYKVQDEDAGNNFFLTKDSIGKSRAKVTTEYLGELNRDVTGDYMEEHPESLLDTNDKFFKQFSIVIATNLCERTLLQLGKCLWEYNIPLLVCRSYGMIGYMRLVVKEHTVIESHPDSVHEDLRLDHPFPGLVKYADSLDLDSMNKKDHSHTPWLIVLYKYLQKWKELHNGEGPKNYREKTQLKDQIREGIRHKEEGGLEEEENFDEAIKAVNTALIPTRVPSDVQSLFNDSECLSLTSSSSSFWIMVRALRDFVQNDGNGNLPLRGTIPDMTADSERYIQLQNCYKHQAELDAQMVSQRVHNLQQSLGQEDVIAEQDIKSFCKNAAFLRLIRCRSLEDEYSNTSDKLTELAHHLDEEDPDDVVYYTLLRAVDRFYDKHNSYPGWYTDKVEADVVKLKTCLSKMLHEWGLSTVIKDDFIHEMCRYGAAELHTVAAFMGGTAAQEAIKVITHQFVPFNNTYIYNAMKQTSVTVQV